MLRLLETEVRIVREDDDQILIYALDSDGFPKEVREVSQASPNQVKNIILSFFEKY